MSSDDENNIARLEPRYQLQSNTQSFEPISLNSQFSQRCHKVFTVPLSSNTTPTKNSSSGYFISAVHQNPFGQVNEWGTRVATPAFTPSPYIMLQAVTSTPIYTMEVNSPMAHHCMFKEAHTISYIQQASHEWIEGNEE
jgi:hypothetical protein